MVDSPPPEEPDALAYGLLVHLVPDHLGVTLQGGLQVQSDIVHQPLLHQLPQPLRPGAVGVQLHLVAQCFHPVDEGEEAVVEGRLPATEAEAC